MCRFHRCRSRITLETAKPLWRVLSVLQNDGKLRGTLSSDSEVNRPALFTWALCVDTL